MQPGAAEGMGERLKRLRLEHYPALSGRAFARRCGVHYTHLNKIEHGRVAPNIQTLQKLAAALELPVSALLE
jgi:transcriptional regulator with XRE-family HTH domain